MTYYLQAIEEAQEREEKELADLKNQTAQLQERLEEVLLKDRGKTNEINILTKEIAQLQKHLALVDKWGKNCMRRTMKMAFRQNNLAKIIRKKNARLEAWQYDDIARDCLAEIAGDYYRAYSRSSSITGEDDYRCSKCHYKKPAHVEGCIVEKASNLLQRLKELKEIE